MARKAKRRAPAVQTAVYCSRCGTKPTPHKVADRNYCALCWEHAIVPAGKYHVSKHGGTFEAAVLKLFPPNVRHRE